MIRKRSYIFAFFAFCAFINDSFALDDNQLSPHRIVYELQLKNASEKQGVVAAKGRMEYEYIGNSCEGFTTTSRIVMNLKGEDGNSIVQDNRTTSFETADDNFFRFITNASINAVPKPIVSGEGKANGANVSIKLSKPAPEAVKLPDLAREGVKFPNAFLKQLIAQAKAKEKFVTQIVYDGGEGGKLFYNTSTTIFSAKPNEGDTKLRDTLQKQGVNDRWRIKISYFNTEKQGDPLPDYSFSAILYENGVTDEIVIDYGDIAFAGKTASFELLPSPNCK